MHLSSERLGRADRRYSRDSASAMPRLRDRFRAIQAWRWADGAPAQPILVPEPAPAAPALAIAA